MGGIASRGQLRWSFARWAAVAVPLVLLLGLFSGRSVSSGADDSWYTALAKPALTPPDWLFPIAWSALYLLMGLALAIVLNARGARGRWPAVAMFAATFAGLLLWSPLFFGAHRIGAATALIAAILLGGIVTAVLFGRVRTLAAWLLVPLLVWVSFAGVLCWRIGQLNPDAARVAPGGHTSQML